jgi:hypothetical protein
MNILGSFYTSQLSKLSFGSVFQKGDDFFIRIMIEGRDNGDNLVVANLKNGEVQLMDCETDVLYYPNQELFLS